jgi:FkbM family methyltransferase
MPAQNVETYLETHGEEAALAALSHAQALRRIHGRGVPVGTIIDVGASNGSWSKMATQIWPDARAHLIEAYDHWEFSLDALAARQPNFSYTMAAAGAEIGTAYFAMNSADPLGGYTSHSGDRLARSVRTVTIDSEAARLQLKPPYLIKLDTHGAERQILAGAEKTLADTSVLVIEVYNFFTEAQRFPAITTLAESYGFHCIDIGEPLFRPHDRAFWQIDLFFVRSDRPEALHQGY